MFITPAENPTENITGDQVREIYTQYGIKNWKELGGPDKELVPLCRNSDSGSQSQLDNMVLKGEAIHPDIYNNLLETTMPGMLRDTAYYHVHGPNKDCYALGYTLYAYLQGHADGDGLREDLKTLSYEGVAPTDETLLNGEYPLVDGYYVVLRKDTPEGTPTRKLLHWMLGEDFAQRMEADGFFPRNGPVNFRIHGVELEGIFGTDGPAVDGRARLARRGLSAAACVPAFGGIFPDFGTAKRAGHPRGENKGEHRFLSREKAERAAGKPAALFPGKTRDLQKGWKMVN